MEPAVQRSRGDLLDQAQTALIALDAGGRVTYWNRHAGILYGFSGEEAMGQHVRDLIVPLRQRKTFEKAIEAALAGDTTETDMPFLHSSGRELHTHLTISPAQEDDAETVGVVMVAFDITERVRTEHRLSINYEITKILAEAEHMYEAAPRILEAICKTLELSVGSLWRLDRIADELRCLEVWSEPRGALKTFDEASRWISFRRGVGLPGRVWMSRSVEWIRDVQVDNNFTRRAAADEAGLHSAFGFPMILRGEVVGVLEFFSEDLREPNEDIIRLMASVGSQLGQFMERKQAEDDRRMSEARKTAILQSSLDCIITMDHLGYILEFNPAAEATFGYRRDDVLGKEMAGLIIPEHLRDAHRKGLLHYLETGDGPVIGSRIEITALRADGSEFPVELAITRVDMPGPPIFSGNIRDITERRESEQERLRLLEAEQKARSEAERASARLARLQTITDAAFSNLSLDDLLEEILDRVRNALGSDMSAILLMRDESPDLAVRAVKGLDLDPSKLPVIPVGEQAAGIVAESGRPLIVEDLQASAVEAPVLKARGMRSLMAVPLLVEARTIGVLITASQQFALFTEEDQMLLRLAADRIAAPILNASLFEREHRIATTLQRSLLPTKLPALPGLSVQARYVPGGRGLDVGGDWYDAMALPNGRVGLVIGDVVGKGIRAASIMGQLRNAMRAYALEGHEPASVVGRINKLTDSFDRVTMATMIYLVYEPSDGSAKFVIAGHPPPLVTFPDGTVSFLDGEKNLPLGVMSEHTYTAERFTLEPGTSIMLYTDGLIEEPGASVDDGLERLRSAVQEGPEDLDLLCDHVLEEVFRERERSDDVAILAIRSDAGRPPG